MLGLSLSKQDTLTNVSVVLGHRLRRLPNITTTLSYGLHSVWIEGPYLGET